MRNIYLTGMMGSGKSVTGKELAKLLKMSFVDLDKKIEEKNQARVAEIFETKGQGFFRDEESFLLNEIARLSEKVVATGGGTVLKEGNVTTMKQSGKVIYLQTSLEWLWKRVEGNVARPLLKGAEPKKSLERIFEERKDIYQSSADYSVNTDGKTASQVAEDIMAILKGKS